MQRFLEGKLSDINLKLRPRQVESSIDGARERKIKIFTLSSMPIS